MARSNRGSEYPSIFTPKEASMASLPSFTCTEFGIGKRFRTAASIIIFTVVSGARMRVHRDHLPHPRRAACSPARHRRAFLPGDSREPWAGQAGAQVQARTQF